MCTAATYKTKDFYFGRTLDYEFSYGDQIVITPRNYVFDLRNGSQLKSHYAMIGMACVMQAYPLYYDAVNEKGLGIAGLNFVGNASYRKPAGGKDNITQFELIPWLLGKCASVKEVRQALENLNLTDTPFSDNLPLAQLHWIIADRDACITVESVQDGLKIYDNPVGVLTNNPPFNYQMFNLNNYMHLAPENHGNTFSKQLERDGRHGASRRPVLSVPVCPRGFCKNEFALRRFGGGKRQPVFPHPRQRRPATRLLQTGHRQV